MSEVEFLKHEKYIQAMRMIERICEQHGIDESHGLPHAVQIAIHVKKALDSLPNQNKPNDQEQENVILAALLHDIDDHKYFKTQNYQNARSVLDHILKSNQRKEKILRMVDLVSFTKNGNRIYPQDPIYYYFTRYADRVEAIGLIGLYRTFQYSQRMKNPFYTQTTAKPSTRQEMYSIMEGRDKVYMQRGGKSESVMDHMFDKPLHIKLPKQVANPYLESLYGSGHDYMVEFVCMHAKTGYQDAEEDLLQRVSIMNQAKKSSTEVYELLK